ncbi:MAG: TonB-dependent receptor, partial [Bacteroidota bacterium]
NVFDPKSYRGVSTNVYGFYSLTIEEGAVDLEYSYIGYLTKDASFILKKDTVLNIKLINEATIEEIEIVAERTEKIEESSQMSIVDVPVKQIKKIPALLGEVDVLKALQLLPGVQSGGEGQSGLYVRGGSPDQNLVLLDGVPVYNVSHLLGIFSVFNADAIKNVTLTKGGFPARYGGRLSSVLEINMKEGNLQEFHGEGSISLIASKLTLELPIIKDRTSILVSGRRTYADLIFKPILKNSQPDGQEIDPTLYFYDLNAKIQHKINDKQRLFLSFYSGQDIFYNTYTEPDLVSEGGIDWGNQIAALRWNWEINNKLFANTTLTYSNYDIEFTNAFREGTGNDIQSFSAKYISGIEDFGGKIDFDYIPHPDHYIKFGVNATNHEYNPGALGFKSLTGNIDIDTLVGQSKLDAREYAVYIEDDIKLGAIKTNIGLHFSAFNVEKTTYTSLQPRLSIRYLLNNRLSIKAAFSTMTQYL